MVEEEEKEKMENSILPFNIILLALTKFVNINIRNNDDCYEGSITKNQVNKKTCVAQSSNHALSINNP